LIAIVDPALFQVRDDEVARAELDAINLMVRRDGLRIPRLREYWDPLWAEFGQPFERSLSHRSRLSLQQLRENGDVERDIPGFDDAKVWRSGFHEMFGSLGAHWEIRMALVIARAASTNEKVVLLTRKVVDRNVKMLVAGGTTLDEVTRWVLYVQPKQIGPKSIPCLFHRRNLTHRWTTRFDWRLPTEEDGAKYPFCPPHWWWKHKTPACRTVEGKPAWIDSHGNGWARPNIEGGRGYHWDVFIQVPNLEQRIGLSQINVVEFGSPEGRVGHIHHTPANKKPFLKDVGWSCP